MQKKKITSLVFSCWITAVLLALVSCSPTGGSLPTPPTPASSSTDSSLLKIIPFFTTESDPNQLAVLRGLINEYQTQHPNVEVDIVLASPASRGRRLLTALASGADLGIFEVEPTLMPQWVDAGYLLPLNDVVDQIGANDFVDGSLYQQNGQVYAVPYAVSVYGLWVRKDLFEQAGLPLPKTYDDVLNAARVLTQGNIYGISLPAGQNIATVNYFSVFLWQNGGDYFTCDGQVAFGQPQALEAIKRWDALTKYAPPGYNTWGYTEQIDAFLNGRVAMTMYGGRLGAQLVESHPELADKVTVIFPTFGDQKVTLGVWSRFAIAASTKNKMEAKAFLEWLTSGDRVLRYDITLPGHMIPALASVRKSALDSSAPYAVAHPDWIQPFYDWAAYTNHPAMNMGSMSNGKFQRSDVVPPWAWEVFGTPGVVDTMLQQIALGANPQSAWQDTVNKLEQTVAGWKSIHPTWSSKDCKGNATK